MSALNRTVRRKCACGEMVTFRYDLNGQAKAYDGQLGSLRPHLCPKGTEASRRIGARVLNEKTPPVQTK
jgi:hypothetical protein